MPTLYWCPHQVLEATGVLGAMAHPDFGRSINPISTRGTDYAHLITTGTPGFSDLPTALHIKESRMPAKKRIGWFLKLDN